MFETRALQTSPELHAIAPAAYPDGNRCKANPSLSAKKKNRAAEAVLFFKEREVFETRALQTPPELYAIAPTAYPDGNRCKANPPTSAKIKSRTAEAVLFFKEREVFETRALQTSPELHAIAPAAYPDGNRCKANPSLSAKKKNRAAEAVLFFKEREVFETRALQTSPELRAIAPAAYPDGNRCCQLLFCVRKDFLVIYAVL